MFFFFYKQYNSAKEYKVDGYCVIEKIKISLDINTTFI